MNQYLKDQLTMMIEDRALSQGDFTLASGAKSSYYIDFSKVSLYHHGLVITTTSISWLWEDIEFDAVGGPVLGAAPLVASLVSRTERLRGFLVRKEPKDHGKGDSLIEGNLYKNDKVVLVEDVTTSGRSVLKAADIVQNEHRCEVVKIISVIDRQAGAEKLLTDAGYDFESLLTASDLTFTLC